MTGFINKIQDAVRFLTQGLERTDSEDDFFTDMVDREDEEGVEYPVDRNVALKTIYNTNETTAKDNDFKVISHSNYHKYEVIVSEPRSYDESVSIVKHLKDKKTIILNLHLLDREQALRIVDFLCGATHALSGNQQKISETVFIFTPNTISLSADSQKKKFISDGVWCQPQ